MVPVVPVAIVGCVFAVVAVAIAVAAYRSRASVQTTGDSDDEDDDDEVVGKISGRETAALMDSEGSSLPVKNTNQRSSDRSFLGYLGSLVRPAAQMKKAPLMHRKSKSVKKIHKPYFYPLLDETAQWFADWESSKTQEQATPNTDDARIDKLDENGHPRDLLDGLDCASLVSFRSNSHLVIPVAAI